MKKEKIVVAIPNEEEFIPSFERWGKNYDWENKEVCFVHIVKQQVYNQMIGIREVPTKEDYYKDEEKIINYLKTISMRIIPDNVSPTIQLVSKLSVSPVEAMAGYLKDINADLVVVATRRKSKFQEIFISSFSDNLIQLSPCDILILRPS